jgi:superfamily II DNA or RNA helicase
MKNFKDIKFPITSQYSSDSEHIPLEFYEDAIPKAKTIDMVLGYFSSNAIKTLCLGFSEFIYLGGSLRIVTNHQLTEEDKINLLTDVEVKNENRIIDIFQDLKLLKEELGPFGEHFFDCLKYLMKQNRLVILPVMHKPNAMAHYKKIILFDGENYLYVSGSANFTSAGIIKNGESFIVDKSWGGETEKQRIEQERNNFDLIFEKKHTSYDYLNPEDVKGIIQHIGNDLTELELLEKAAKIIRHFSDSAKIKKVIDRRTSEFQNIINNTKKGPRFPYDEGPREYQKKAYINWKNKNNVGLFAMATGTGKTLTSAYCLIEEFKLTGIQKNIIVVPGKELVEQWYDELKGANFTRPVKWYSGNTGLNKEIEHIKLLKQHSNFNALNVIITYDSFSSERFLSVFKSILKDFIIVFDETHNMGAKGFMGAIKNLEFGKRIGLSATPLRLWDENNENQFIEDFFQTSPPYTFSFTMEEAIEKGYLCKYHYEPFFVTFSCEEWEEYLKLTRQLHNKQKNEKINTKAALKRQLLKDQAESKTSEIIKIIKKLIEINSFKNTLIYCPKGYDNNERYIHILQDLIQEKFPSINTATFLGETNNRDLLLKDFEDETVHMLLAIKCLDEGVNIPKTMNAIFVASGQNYREFIQRRGRVLRNYKKNDFTKEFAEIYDVVLLPSLNQYNNNRLIAERLVISEFKRMYEFYNLASDKFSTYKKINNALETYGLTEGYIRSQLDINQ